MGPEIEKPLNSSRPAWGSRFDPICQGKKKILNFTLSVRDSVPALQWKWTTIISQGNSRSRVSRFSYLSLEILGQLMKMIPKDDLLRLRKARKKTRNSRLRAPRKLCANTFAAKFGAVEARWKSIFELVAEKSNPIRDQDKVQGRSITNQSL